MDNLFALRDRAAVHFLRPDVEQPDGRCRFAPEWLVLCVNNFCNLKCRMCDVGNGESASVFFANMIGDHPGSMSLDLLRTALDGAEAFRPKPKIGLAFTEPLNHARIVEFVREITSRGFFCSITTNGFLLPRRANALVQAGVDEIVVSVDGPPETHDRIRGREGSFSRLFEGIEKVQAARGGLGVKKPRVLISSTICDYNFTQLRSTLEALAPLRPSAVNFAHMSYITEGMAGTHNAMYGGELAVARSSIGVVDLGKIELAELASEIASAREFARSQMPGTQLTFHPELSALDDLQRYYREPELYVGGRRCTDPFKMMMVKVDGEVIPAHSRCYNYPLGRVQDSPLTAIWNNARYVAFRRLLHGAGGSLPACTRCCGVVGKPGEPERSLLTQGVPWSRGRDALAEHTR